MKARDVSGPGRRVIAYLGVGSNLDEPAEQVRSAFRELDQIPGTRCVRTSSLYLSPPLGPVEQPDFINAVAVVATGLPWKPSWRAAGYRRRPRPSAQRYRDGGHVPWIWISCCMATGAWIQRDWLCPIRGCTSGVLCSILYWKSQPPICASPGAAVSGNWSRAVGKTI